MESEIHQMARMNSFSRKVFVRIVLNTIGYVINNALEIEAYKFIVDNNDKDKSDFVRNGYTKNQKIDSNFGYIYYRMPRIKRQNGIGKRNFKSKIIERYNQCLHIEISDIFNIASSLTASNMANILDVLDSFFNFNAIDSMRQRLAEIKRPIFLIDVKSKETISINSFNYFECKYALVYWIDNDRRICYSGISSFGEELSTLGLFEYNFAIKLDSLNLSDTLLECSNG
jgi:hypothetical protein